LQEKGVKLGEYLNKLAYRCFVDGGANERWVEPLLRFLAMPSVHPGELDTPDHVSESDAGSSL
jgi:hypothetical protein